MTETQKLGYRFLHDFSRFEFSLKAAGFLQKGNDAHPDWDTFAKSIDDITTVAKINSEDFQRSANYFFDKPPRKQIVKNNKMLGWEDHKGGSGNFGELIILVRRVRNNFFHGGKFATGHVIGSERDADLLMHALIILSACLELNQDIKNRFFEE